MARYNIPLVLERSRVRIPVWTVVLSLSYYTSIQLSLELRFCGATLPPPWSWRYLHTCLYVSTFLATSQAGGSVGVATTSLVLSSQRSGFHCNIGWLQSSQCRLRRESSADNLCQANIPWIYSSFLYFSMHLIIFDFFVASSSSHVSSQSRVTSVSGLCIVFTTFGHTYFLSTSTHIFQRTALSKAAILFITFPFSVFSSLIYFHSSNFLTQCTLLYIRRDPQKVAMFPNCIRLAVMPLYPARLTVFLLLRTIWNKVPRQSPLV